MELKFMSTDDLLGWIVDNREELDKHGEFTLAYGAKPMETVAAAETAPAGYAEEWKPEDE